MNVIGVNNNINQKTYSPNFGQLVFSSQTAKDYFFKKISQVPYRKRGLVKKLTELVYAMKTDSQKGIIDETSIELQDETGKTITSKALCHFSAPQTFYLNTTKTKRRPPKPVVDTYYVDTLIETLKSIIEKNQPKAKVKNLPPIEKLVEECPTEAQMPLHLRMIMEGEI